MKFIFLVPLLLAFFSIKTQAAPLRLFVQEKLSVYEFPDNTSKKISILDRGDEVLISPKVYGNFRKVQITYKGEKRPGFVFIEDIKFSYMRSKASRIEFSNHQIYRQNKTMSLGVSFNYLLQDGYRIESSGYSLETTEFTSISAAFNFSHEWPWKDHFNLRASVAFKNANWSSEIKQTGATLPANFINEVEDNIGYLAIGGLLKWYPTSSQTFWLGPGLEYMWDRGGRERKISGNLDTDKGLDDASYINFSISTGIDVHLTDNFFLLPEFKASTSLDQTPSIYGLEAGLAIGYVY